MGGGGVSEGGGLFLMVLLRRRFGVRVEGYLEKGAFVVGEGVGGFHLVVATTVRH